MFAVLVDGYAEGGAAGARTALENFWRRVSEAARFRPAVLSSERMSWGRDAKLARRSMLVCRCSMPNGPAAIATPPNYRDGLNPTAFAVPSGWSASGRPSVVAPKNASDQQLQKILSARTIARLTTTARDHLSKADTVTIAAIEVGVPTLVAARTLNDRFHTMVKQSTEADLLP